MFAVWASTDPATDYTWQNLKGNAWAKTKLLPGISGVGGRKTTAYISSPWVYTRKYFPQGMKDQDNCAGVFGNPTNLVYFMFKADPMLFDGDCFFNVYWTIQQQVVFYDVDEEYD